MFLELVVFYSKYFFVYLEEVGYTATANTEVYKVMSELLFQISLAATDAVNLRVHCLLEPVWNLGHRGQGGMRSVSQ